MIISAVLTLLGIMLVATGFICFMAVKASSRKLKDYSIDIVLVDQNNKEMPMFDPKFDESTFDKEKIEFVGEEVQAVTEDITINKMSESDIFHTLGFTYPKLLSKKVIINYLESLGMEGNVAELIVLGHQQQMCCKETYDSTKPFSWVLYKVVIHTTKDIYKSLSGKIKFKSKEDIDPAKIFKEEEPQ